jgi:hypothetical protein
MDNSINLEAINSESDFAHIVSETNMKTLEDEQSFIGQQDLYGSIIPSPTKVDNLQSLPALNEKLILPKQRKRSNSLDSKFHENTTKTKEKHVKRPSTCGKRGIRNFSTPLPLKIKSLEETFIPKLTPENSSLNNEENTTIDSSNMSLDLSMSMKTPQLFKNNKFTSPLSIRSFSTPLADIRSKSDTQTAIQIKLNQLSSKEYMEETERQLKRDIQKYEKELSMMKKIKKYRDSKESEKLDALIEKWRSIAEMGSNYIFNEAKIKIEKMGGIKQFKLKEKKAKLRKMKFEFDENLLYKIEEYITTEEYKNLDDYEKEEILAKQRELEEMSEKLERGELPLGDDDKDDDDNDEFTMKDLYKQLKLDYNLVYGSH